MTAYTVLARKCRPKQFAEMVGQQHVLPALIHALEQNRLHHAYLFTGTRGVGKTTVARIFAKCLNCEQGVSATPCGQCQTCLDIDAGRFIDLMEVDAASRTKVEDTRELLDNVQYAPTKGRYKIYLIDEVHMLSNHSFNALLKTLEEPPEHVLFLLATTDPQKLPITVLSRCLQFHLKALTIEQITQQCQLICEQESIPCDSQALLNLADAAQGSLRDALSLLDQAIVFSNNNITVDAVNQMLGQADRDLVWTLLENIQAQQLSELLSISQEMALQNNDFSHCLQQLLEALHDIAIAQVSPDCITKQKDKVLAFAKQFDQETIQLYYQIVLLGQKDLALTANPKMGFEMVLLRLMSFKPFMQTDNPVIKRAQPSVSTPKQSVSKAPEKPKPVSNDPWQALLAKLHLSGMTQLVASNCALESQTATELRLRLDETHSPLLSNNIKERLQAAIHQHLGNTVKLHIEIGTPHTPTPAAQLAEVKAEQQSQATTSIQSDPHLQQLMNTFDANIQKDSIQSNSDNK